VPSLYLDCSFGIAGDMLLAALVDLGLDQDGLRRLFAPLGLAWLEFPPLCRQGIMGRRLDLEASDAQPVRRLPQIAKFIESLDASAQVRRQSLLAFQRLAEVEARAHGCAVEQIHFHELGAVDTLVDVVGVFWGLEQLGIRRVVSSPLPWFRGQIRCAHGTISLPAPATAALLEGKPVQPSDFEFECVTPTGALLVDRIASSFASGPSGRLLQNGLGYGAKDSGGGLRVFLYEAEAEKQDIDASASFDARVERVWVLESNVDHLSGEDLGRFFGALFSAGALDVLYAPGVMKKNRPAGALQVICKAEDLETCQRAFFKHSLTLGLRRSLTERVTLPRRAVELSTPYGPLLAKECVLDGERILRPESDSLAALAAKTGLSSPELRQILASLGLNEPKPEGQAD
jgi:uncharacterized protein (TIGR00299 family) protein